MNGPKLQPKESNNARESRVGEKKRLKVQLIQNNPSTQMNNNVNFLINPKTWPMLREGDILEISAQVPSSNQMQSSAQNTNSANQLNNSFSRTAMNSQSSQMALQFNQISQNASSDDDLSPFLVQVVQASFNENIPTDIIRIDQAASSAPFSIKALSYVMVTIVEKSSVTLDLVELLFKEQYLNGNDMLRIKKHIENTCVYIKKNIEFCSMRCSIREMWMSKGDVADVVSCGYINEKTRLVFRSQSAMCTIYIQMSREMWEFDVNGEMYHEKAINFLGELFTNWKKQTCQHDVTIALFSRVFYKAESRDDFPSSIRSEVEMDHKNRFYEDFYRIVYQNERYEDWTQALVVLKRLIKEYNDYVLNYHRRQLDSDGLHEEKMPEAYLSSAAEGNFLETLNLSSSVFERHYIDRPFDRTGMMSLVITPGNGVYEVSRELAKITKERVIDNGIGSDLVCLGEQPLHAVPLFKYDQSESAFNIPHWINLSFYKSSETVRYCNSNFMPSSKIKVRKEKNNTYTLNDAILPGYKVDKENYLASLRDTDNIFVKSRMKKDNSESFDSFKKDLSSTLTVVTSNMATPNDSQTIVQVDTNNKLKPRRPKYSEMSSSLNMHELSTYMKHEDEIQENSSSDADSDDASSKTTKRLKTKINPFMPSSIKPRMSFERRRWAHIFPLRSDGTPIYPNWVSVNTSNDYEIILNQEFSYEPKPLKASTLMPSKQMNEMPYVDESNATMKTGVAWKSLTIPAYLPLTTDYDPSKVISADKIKCSSSYSLIPEDIRYQYQNNNIGYKKISMSQVFIDLVGYRLAMGFQMIVPKANVSNNDSKKETTVTSTGKKETSMLSSNTKFPCELNQSFSSTYATLPLSSIKGYYKLSLGNIFHELFYIVDEASKTDWTQIEIYVPKKKDSKSSRSIPYKYRFQVPDSKAYVVSDCVISRKSIEQIKWNLIDSYICIQGNGTLTISELKTCWSQRIYMLPMMFLKSNWQVNEKHQDEQQQLDLTQVPESMLVNNRLPVRCDVYQRKSNDELKVLRDYFFLKFMEILNKLNRVDDKRALSKSTLASMESLLNQTEQTLAVPTIVNALNCNNSMNPQNRQNQLSFVLPKQHQIEKLKSPKVHLFPLVSAYLAMEESAQKEALKGEIIAYLDTQYKQHFLNQTYGMPFILNKNDIPLNCFISAEAVWWCMSNIEDVQSEADAIRLMQIMCDFDLVRHISIKFNVFIHGFYLYYVITEANIDHNLYTKDYCEVGFCDVDCGQTTSTHNSLVSVNNLLSESNTLPVHAAELLNSYRNILKGYSKTEMSIEPIKLVNVDVDPNRRSSRVEWASAFYRSHYHSLCAFELEIQWEMATGSLLFELINSWAKLANRFNYHIVPGPIDPFALPLHPNSDPLRGPIYIRLAQDYLIKNEQNLFQSYVNDKYKNIYEEIAKNKQKRADEASLMPLIERNCPEFVRFLLKKYTRLQDVEKYADDDRNFLLSQFEQFMDYERVIRLQYFQEAILEKYGFIRNAGILKSSNQEEDLPMFIHSSGGMFVSIQNHYNNYSIRSRHASSNSKNAEMTSEGQHMGVALKAQETSPKSIGCTEANTRDRSKSHHIQYLKMNEKSMQIKVPSAADNETFVGFSWSWNFMLGKRWRSQFTGDECYQDNILADFRLFCSNLDGRLFKFYTECKENLK